MYLIDKIKSLIYPQDRDIVLPLVHRVHLVKRSFVVVDCEMGCDRRGLKRIIEGYLASGIYEKERIPLLIYYRENSNHAHKRIQPFLRRYEALRLKIWFYESPSLPFGLSIIGTQSPLSVTGTAASAVLELAIIPPPPSWPLGTSALSPRN